MRLFIAVLILIFTLPTPSQADDIRDFQIEGISIGDSLLDYASEEKIKSEIKKNKRDYQHLKNKDKFGEVYIHNDENFKIYQKVSFFVKPDDRNYIIYLIRGILNYIEDIDGCLNKQKEITKEIAEILPKFDKREINSKHSIDPSGRSTNNHVIFEFKTGDDVSISCINFEESLRKKNNWIEGLSVVITKKEVADWLKNKK
ncbi:MAG: hypothetical protein QF864_10725 [SAR202 cluster bacterium]|nr:hypothetical protein [SAR202 cluster bacterium]